MHELSIVSSLVESVLNFVETQPVKGSLPCGWQSASLPVWKPSKFVLL